MSRALAALLVLATAAPAQGPAQAVDRLVRDGMKQWQVPGLALVVVHEGRVVYLQGFGTKELGKPGAVTADTVFPLASCTKPFTTLALAMLVDDGKLGWDDPVRKHVPFFHLADPAADADVRLRDLVTHRTGLDSHDLMWYRAPWGLEERVRRLAHLPPALPFRSGFRYQTIAFGAAGLAAGRASGTTWDRLVSERVLGPLDMKATTAVFPGGADLAAPHRKGPDGQVRVIERYPLRDPDPAGSVHSTARDLAAFLRFQLADGTWQGRRLVSAGGLAEAHRPQAVIPRGEFARAMNPETLFLNYGLGWIVQDYRGKLMLLHGGAIDGFRAHLTLVPELRLGVGVLSNLDRGFVNLALANAVTDLYLGAPPRDWAGYYLEILEEEQRQDRARAKALREKMSRSRGPARPLADYAGDYEDAAYGPCGVRVEDGRLVWRWRGFRYVLEHVEADTFVADGGILVDALLMFTAPAGGKIDRLKVLEREFRR